MSARQNTSACAELEPLLHAECDGELVDEARAQVHAHVAECPACRARMERIVGLKSALRQASQATDIPDQLVARIRADLALEPPPLSPATLSPATLSPATLSPATLSPATLSPATTPRRRSVAPAVIAAAALAVAAGLGALYVRSAPAASAAESAGPDVIAAVVERHTRDLPVDVASPDPQSVAAFLAPRVGHAVRVPRLDLAGWGLFGGRVVDVHVAGQERRASQLVYRGGLDQKVSLVDIPDDAGELKARLRLDARPVTLQRGAHALRLWSADGAVHALVGELAVADIERLSSSLER